MAKLKEIPSILTDLQREVLDGFFGEEAFRENFYLTGGTALSAFYLGHRLSDDLDFFTHADTADFLWPFVQRLEKEIPLVAVQRTPDFLRIRVRDELRVDFVRDVPFRVGVPFQKGTWRVDTLENILLNKVTTVLSRLDAKDYVDLYFLLKERPERILSLLKEASQKDASVDPFTWSRLIGDVHTFETLPRMVLPLTLKELVDFFEALQRTILNSLKPSRR